MKIVIFGISRELGIYLLEKPPFEFGVSANYGGGFSIVYPLILMRCHHTVDRHGTVRLGVQCDLGGAAGRGYAQKVMKWRFSD